MPNETERSEKETRENLAEILEKEVMNHDPVEDATVTEVDMGTDGQPTDYTVSINRRDQEELESEEVEETAERSEYDTDVDSVDIDHLQSYNAFIHKRWLTENVDHDGVQIDLSEEFDDEDEEEEGQERLTRQENVEQNKTQGTDPDMQSQINADELQNVVHQAARQVAAIVGGTVIFGIISMYSIWYGATSGVPSIAATGILLMGVVFYHLMRLRP